MAVEQVMEPITPEPPQYYLFKEYSRAVKEFLTEVVYLSRFDRDHQPNIYYSTPSRAWATYVQPIINGFAETPVCTFYLSGAEPKQSEIMGWGHDRIQDPNNEDKYVYSFAPSIWKLNFKTTIWTKTINDMDVILSQIFLYSQTPKLWACMVDGAWCEIGVDSFSIDDDMEPGESKDKIIRRGLNTYVRRAYLPRESFDIPKINEINLALQDAEGNSI